MSEQIVLIDVDDLGIDTTNIRGGEWEYDRDLVESIRENGVIEPLVVRRAKPDTDVKYAIICGSRRFNGSIEAGLTEVPCIIKDIDDLTAIGLSIMENKHRKDIPGWRYALKIGEMYERLNGKGNKTEIVSIIMIKTGFSRTSVQDYIEISGLPGEIIELMKEPGERSEIVKELLKGMPVTGKDKPLSYDKAVKIARELKNASFEKMFETAAYVRTLAKDTAFGIIERVMSYPMKSMEEIHTMVKSIPMGMRWMMYWGSDLVRAIDEACAKRQMDNKSLVIYYVEDGLRRDGFIG